MKRHASTTCLLCCLASFVAHSASPAAEGNSTSESTISELLDAGNFEPPKPARRVFLEYPDGEAEKGDEGWVQVEFMVDAHGKTFESTVSDSSGNPVLEKAALKVVSNLAYQPATENGQPIVSSATLKFKWQIYGQTGARDVFISRYRKFMRAVKSSNQTEASQLLPQLTPANLYEDAYYGLAQYEYALSWGSDEDQIRGLRRAIAHEKTAAYLPKDIFYEAMVSLLPLDVKTGDYTRALDDWDYLNSNASDRKVLDTWRPFIERIKALRTSSTSLRVHGSLDGGDWHFTPYKQTLEFDVASGHLATLKFRCGKHFEVFDIVPGAKYRIEPSFGPCSIEAIGDRGTKFDLIES